MKDSAGFLCRLRVTRSFYATFRLVYAAGISEQSHWYLSPHASSHLYWPAVILRSHPNDTASFDEGVTESYAQSSWVDGRPI